jgi:NAD(P)-dependent dehydrogenase (short-subunit alcohol dehydrogenase family)
MDLTNRHVVVTGAAGGIGRALAERFHQAGAHVVAADLDEDGARRTAEALLAIRPDSAIGIGADVGSEAGNVALIQAADDHFGQIDLFFANAGVGVGALLDTPEDVWQQAFAVNTHSHR